MPARFFGCLAGAVLCASGWASDLQPPPADGREPLPPAEPGADRVASAPAGPDWQRWERAGRMRLPEKTLSVNLPARWAIRFFQRFVSPVDGPSCEFAPSCSSYGLEAVRKHGLLIGIPMAAERIVRNHHPDHPIRYPLVELGGEIYYLDPVASNDFWWAEGP